MDSGFGMIEIGVGDVDEDDGWWVLGAGCWVLGAGCWILSSAAFAASASG